MPGVPEDLSRVKALFSSLGYAEILPELDGAPDAQQVRAGLEDWLKADERCKEDVLVVYYAGHGLRDERSHRPTCRNSRQDRMSTTLASRELADLLADTRVGHVLLLLDTCYAELGAGGLPARRVRGAVAGRRGPLPGARVRPRLRHRPGGRGACGHGRDAAAVPDEALAEHLRDPRRSREDQRRMTAELIASVPPRTDGGADAEDESVPGRPWGSRSPSSSPPTWPCTTGPACSAR
ncbi:caspase family protein [Streptomyces sp. MB09-01]|nr:caspase family protein [Streptomyces sp. MB09-01]